MSQKRKRLFERPVKVLLVEYETTDEEEQGHVEVGEIGFKYNICFPSTIRIKPETCPNTTRKIANPRMASMYSILLFSITNKCRFYYLSVQRYLSFSHNTSELAISWQLLLFTYFVFLLPPLCSLQLLWQRPYYNIPNQQNDQ